MLKYFLEALCGQEEPLLAFKGGKYVSVAPVPDTMGKEMGSQEGKQLEDEVLCGESPLWQREGSPPHPQSCSAHFFCSYPVIYNHSEQYGCGRDQTTSQECTLLVPLPASPTPVSPSHSATSSRCFFLMLHWRRREGKKEFNNVQLGRLRKGGGAGGVRVQAEDQVYRCVELSAAQA